MLVKIKGIHKVRMTLADGSTRIYYYAWRGGPQMKSKPHTQAFIDEHARYRDAEKAQEVDTLETLIDRFTGAEKTPIRISLRSPSPLRTITSIHSSSSASSGPACRSS